MSERTFEERFPGDDHQAENAAELSALEQLIFDSRDYVVPSRDLRPRVLESAGEQQRFHRLAKHSGFLAMAGMLVWSLSIPAVQSLSELRENICGPSGSDIEQLAWEYSPDSTKHADWGIVDVFTQLRTLRIHQR